ncbi:MAG TPA: GNAT family N-acetyltransferase [Kofleriaceae bacterium]|nr:GNAT family N-acetyltransferase [Kofleriaceae bacterium]
MSASASRGLTIQASFALAAPAAARRSSAGTARGAATSVQPAAVTAQMQGQCPGTSAARAMDAMRARAPRPELMPARLAAVQRAIGASRQGTAQPAAVTPLRPQTLQLQRGGQPLPSAVRRRMESLFGADLSEVRIHQGAQPAAIDAVAFTAGSDIYFAPGQYRPTEPAGQRLLAKQLTYVLQQRTGLARNPHGRGMVLVRDPALDAQAEQIGELAGRPGVVQAKQLPAARGLFQVKAQVAGPGRQHLELYERGHAVGAADVVLEGQRTKLYNLRVEAEHRGRGGGEELVRAAAAASERIGKRTLTLEADDDGSGKLVRWYQSQGFRPIGEGRDGKPAFEASVRELKKR